MLTPKMKVMLVRLGACLALVVVVVWLMRALSSVTTMLLVSFFLAYILNPLARNLSNRGLGRSGAAVFLLALGFLGFMVLVFLILPAIMQEIRLFASVAPKYWDTLKSFVSAVAGRLNIQIPSDWDEITTIIFQKGGHHLPSVADFSTRLIATLFKSTVSIFSSLIYFLLVPILTYYFLVSFEDITKWVEDLIPYYAREPVIEKLTEIDRILAAFIRGQLTIALIMGSLYSVGFLIIGIDLAFVLGILAGILWLIPYMGTLFALVSGCLMALGQYGDLLHLVYVLILAGLIQVLEGYILTPRIVGQAIGLHPVVYILAIIIGANLFGFVGVLVAIPVAAILKVLLKSALAAYQTSYLYREPSQGQEKA